MLKDLLQNRKQILTIVLIDPLVTPYNYFIPYLLLTNEQIIMIVNTHKNILAMIIQIVS